MKLPPLPIKKGFREAELRWQEIELDVARLQENQRDIAAYIHAAHQSTYEQAWVTYDIIGEQIRKLSLEQQEIEEYLIENEAPGWTST
jgi:hypothetical protein